MRICILAETDKAIHSFPSPSPSVRNTYDSKLETTRHINDACTDADDGDDERAPYGMPEDSTVTIIKVRGSSSTSATPKGSRREVHVDMCDLRAGPGQPDWRAMVMCKALGTACVDVGGKTRGIVVCAVPRGQLQDGQANGHDPEEGEDNRGTGLYTGGGEYCEFAPRCWW